MVLLLVLMKVLPLLMAEVERLRILEILFVVVVATTAAAGDAARSDMAMVVVLLTSYLSYSR